MRKIPLLKLFLLFLGSSVLGSCVSGFIYSEVTLPLVTNFDNTPVGSKHGEMAINELRYQVSVQWGSDAIGEAAKRGGIEKIYYADLRTITVLGVWKQETVIVYGD